MGDPAQYILNVTGGPHYEDRKVIEVNTSKSLDISSEQIDAHIHVRVKDFRGLPESSPATCSYFTHAPHTSDRYSISFTFTPKSTINGNDLVFGNDFDHPIRDKLPPLFDKAFSVVKSWIDPGLYGDPYADKPHLYGPLLSSVNVLRVGEKGMKKVGAEESGDSGPILEEGADGEEAAEIRKECGIPEGQAARMKFFLDEGKRKEFTFEEGRTYSCDFFNPYLDFNEFALRLPMGLRLNILGSWDGQPLRYVMRNRKTDELLFVVNFALVPKDQADGGEVKEPEKEKTNEKDKPAETPTPAAGATAETTDDDLD